MKPTEKSWGLRVRRSELLLVRYGCFLEAFRDGRRSGGRQPALRRPGALRRRTTGSPTADSFVSHVQYLLWNRIFFHVIESKYSIAPATDAQDRGQNIHRAEEFLFPRAIVWERRHSERTETACPKIRQPKNVS